MFPGLARPHEVEGVVREVHGEGVHHEERGVRDALLRGQRVGAFRLLLRQGDARDRGVRSKPFREVPRRAADAAADVEHSCRGAFGAPRTDGHLLHEIELGLDEVLHLAPEERARASREILVGVVSEMDVFAPVILEDLLLGPGVVLAPDGGVVGPRATGGVEVAFYPGVGPTDGQTRERRLSRSDELGGADGGRGERCADGREVGTRKDGRGGDGAHLECGRSRGGGRARDAVRRKRRARELVKRQAMGLGRGVDGRQTCCDRAARLAARGREDAARRDEGPRRETVDGCC